VEDVRGKKGNHSSIVMATRIMSLLRRRECQCADLLESQARRVRTFEKGEQLKADNPGPEKGKKVREKSKREELKGEARKFCLQGGGGSSLFMTTQEILGKKRLPRYFWCRGDEKKRAARAKGGEKPGKPPGGKVSVLEWRVFLSKSQWQEDSFLKIP